MGFIVTVKKNKFFNLLVHINSVFSDSWLSICSDIQHVEFHLISWNYQFVLPLLFIGTWIQKGWVKWVQIWFTVQSAVIISLPLPRKTCAIKLRQWVKQSTWLRLKPVIQIAAVVCKDETVCDFKGSLGFSFVCFCGKMFIKE